MQERPRIVSLVTVDESSTMHPVTLETFAPFVGRAFRLPTGTDEDVEIVLHAATPIRLAAVDPRALGLVPGVRADPFSLIFVAPVNVTIPQGIYRMFDPDGVERVLGLVPIGPGTGGLHYQAIFN